MKKLNTFAAALALCLGLAPVLEAQDGYTRFKQGKTDKDAALQIAQATFEKPGSDVKIVLYGVVHIADKAYYSAVQKDLDAYDVVLWEGVKPGKRKVKPDESLKNLGEMQKMLCEILGLTFQKDGINYKRDNFVWADMDSDQLQDAFGKDANKAQPGAGMFNQDMLKNMGPMLKMGAQFMKFLFKSQPQMRSKMKMQFAQQLSNAGSGAKMPGMSDDFQRVILVERNKVVMKFLKKQMKTTKKGSIAIFYGAAHMPDLAKRLNKMGFKETDRSWKTAWKIGKGASAKGGSRPKTQSPKKSGKKKRWF